MSVRQVLDIKTILKYKEANPNWILTGENKRIYDEFIASQVEFKTPKKIKRVKKIKQELVPDNIEEINFDEDLPKISKQSAKSSIPESF